MHLFKYWSTENKEKLRNVLQEDFHAVGFGFQFDLFGNEYFFYYVWISDFICFDFNASDKWLRLEIYRQQNYIYNIYSTLVNLYLQIGAAALKSCGK